MQKAKNINIAELLKQNLVICGIIILCIVTAVIEPKFLSITNLNNLLKQLSALPFAALGMTFVIIAGFIDLSIPGMISLSGIITVMAINYVGQIPAIIIGIAAGTLMGWINGFTLTKSGAHTQAEVLFITFGFSSIWIALGLVSTNAEVQRLEKATHSVSILTKLGTASIGIVPVMLIIFLIFLALSHIFMTKTLLGRSICLLGGNKSAAFLCGFNTDRIMRFVYALNGAFAALAGIALVARTTVINSGAGQDYETNAILCVVVGGTTLKGGKGSVLRTMVGVVLITLLSNCMNMLGLSTYMQTIMRGTVLVIAIWLDNRKEQ